MEKRSPSLNKIIKKSSSELSEIPDDAVDCIITSPPYEQMRVYSSDPNDLGNYQGREYVERLKPALQEMWRVLKETGSVFINFQPQTIQGFLSPTAYQLPQLFVEVGFKIVQELHWLKTNPHPINNNRLLKPATESIWQLAKSGNYYCDKDAVRRPSLHAARDKRVWKYNPLGKDPGSVVCPALDRLSHLSIEEILNFVVDGESDILIQKKSQDQAAVHPAKMPDEVARFLVLYGSKLGDIVLDPFCGSGTTCLVAKALGRNFIGCDLNPEYVRLAQERIAAVGFGEALEAVSTSSAPPPHKSRATPRPARMEPRFVQCANKGCPEQKYFQKKRPWQNFCSDKCRFAVANQKRRSENNDKKADG